ncbi:Arc family DNA-binding protein [Ramlibacter sp.]|uniref:FitA-like ribbon-helix-helix domain-containing protein n=1 Tax=Ramlibacter sp. TaxID=1917967 RepID=UPI0017AA4EE8|nr:Arc family DNA-binding protein [Ramlibacter sp.]MBA2676358.1 Arc family DNA-binding protein [Ramlibacter sp.]
MPNLSIKDVPEDWAERLRARAASNHRSLQGELMAILEQAVQGDSPAAVSPSSQRRGTRTLEDIARAQRIAFPQPVRGGPLAVDLIRADRDSR